MTEEKKKPEEDGVTEEQLEDVAGGFLERFPNVPLKGQESKKKKPVNRVEGESTISSMDREGTIE
jgi:hypothetical protein